MHHEELDVAFRSQDKEHASHDDALVISIRMANAYVKRVMIDTGSSADILYFNVFQRLGLTDLDLTPLTSTLTRFTGDSISPMGTTTIPVTIGGEPRSKTLMVPFMVVRLPSAYNAIIGRPTLNRLRAVVSTYHRVLKFPTRNGVGEVRSDPKEFRQCYLAATTLCKKPRTGLINATAPDPAEDARDAHSAEKILELPLDPSRIGKMVKVGSELTENQQIQLIYFLMKNDDVFAWTPNDMPGVDPEIAQHYLNISPDARPVKQRPRKFAPDRQKAIEDEVTRLLDAQLVEEVKYPTWLSNIVLVKKANGNWRMCVDYTDLNRACPKDCYPLPRIDQLVDATSGHQLFSFMDAFSGYNQIQMAPRDKRNTAFITHNGTYCYKVMPFGLKNAGATYQRLVNRMFKDQVGRNMEIYVDDMIVKSRHAETHLSDLEETFRTLRKYRMRLNPTKCTFGITAGKFLGFIVHQRGIDANPDKIKAIQEMQSPKTVKEVQRLAGRIAAMSRFISRAGDKSSVFLRALKSAKDFKWTPECEEAFHQLKSHLENLPQLASVKDGEPLGLYLAASNLAVSSVLVTLDRTGERPVYYTSHVLAGPELRYAPIERIALAFILASRKLRPYFQTHPIKVITDQPLRQILSKFDVAGRMLKWSVELGEFDIEYEPRKTIKGQVLADFLSELMPPPVPQNPTPGWTIHIDGSANSERGGVGLVFKDPSGHVYEHALRLGFRATNNEAEYEALLFGLKVAADLGAEDIEVFTDSQLVAGQVNGTFETREAAMIKYLAEVRLAAARFQKFAIIKVPRNENTQADALAKLASSRATDTPTGPTVRTVGPSIGPTLMTVSQEDGGWTNEILHFKQTGVLPEDKAAAQRVRRAESWYYIIDGRLYRRGFSRPLLRCLNPTEAQTTLAEIHEGICGNHVGARTLAHMVLRQGYYWPTLRKDAQAYVQNCEPCQKHARFQHRPMVPLSTADCAWPFAQWGMDLLGPFPPASGQRKFLIVRPP
ncbi:hypothetical protein OPV22_020812 [Ensete ventricosum]|uniref:RNase H type-1 domain-containing protein n=1 Tax=Ensete ventricosum TaxID=4639 RepID=A0AAV8QNX3_ENSVE|nr:hypothetical protein OPV22_020812 [Ensete ventricosum]